MGKGAPAQHRPKNNELRPREYLTLDEVEKLMKAARDGRGRYGHRDATLILIGFRHGLRATEFRSGVVAGRARPLGVAPRSAAQERQALGASAPRRRDQGPARAAPQFPDSAFVFATERGGPFTSAAINRLIKRIGVRAKLPFPVHVHMLRHACGYALANAGHDTRALQDWLGHRNIQHTVRYTELSPTRFKDFWRD